MSGEPIELVTSVTKVMEQENELLRGGRRSELGELAAAKLRLVAELERVLAERTREGGPEWAAALAVEERERFASAIAGMQEVAAENAQLLRRQIDLSRELMDAIASEAKRLSGTRSEVYGSGGGLQRSDLSAPIAVNANL